MRVDACATVVGTHALVDLSSFDSRPPRVDGMFERASYEGHAAAGRLFFFEPAHGHVGEVMILVDEEVPAALGFRIYGSVHSRLLKAPSGELLFCPVPTIAEDAPPQYLEDSVSFAVEPGDYLVDAHLLAPKEGELRGPTAARWVEYFHSGVVFTTAWLLFCTLVLAIFAWKGGAGDALPLYLRVGVAPLVVIYLLYRVTGARRRMQEAKRGYASLPTTPSVIVTLKPLRNTPIAEGGGIDAHDHESKLDAMIATP